MTQLNQLGRVFAARARVRVLEELLGHGPLSAEDLGSRLGLRPVTVHHHLRVLGRTGMIEETAPYRSGRSGRPSSLFRVAPQPSSVQFPPRNFAALADMALELLSETMGPDGMRRAARKLANKFGRSLGRELLSRSGLRSWTLADVRKWFLEGHVKEAGFCPEVVEAGSDCLRYRLHNCLVRESATKFPDFVCSMDLPMLRAILRETMGGGSARRLSCMGRGDSYCEYAVRTR